MGDDALILKVTSEDGTCKHVPCLDISTTQVRSRHNVIEVVTERYIGMFQDWCALGGIMEGSYIPVMPEKKLLRWVDCGRVYTAEGAFPLSLDMTPGGALSVTIACDRYMTEGLQRGGVSDTEPEPTTFDLSQMRQQLEDLVGSIVDGQIVNQDLIDTLTRETDRYCHHIIESGQASSARCDIRVVHDHVIMDAYIQPTVSSDSVSIAIEADSQGARELDTAPVHEDEET